MMYRIWLKICRHFSHKSEEYWKDVMFKQGCWESIRLHHYIILRDGKRLISILSRNIYDGRIMEKAEKLQKNIAHSRCWLKVDWNTIYELKHKGLLISQKELALCTKYHEEAYEISYKCCEKFFAAQVAVGCLTPSKRNERLKHILKERYTRH
jgi:hypothetical protein